MTKGVVLFAFNNNIEYTKLAQDVAKRVHRFLDLPVSIVTDSEIQNVGLFDKIFREEDRSLFRKVYKDGQKEENLIWKNHSRADVFNLSPYEETLVLDVDYVLQSDFLKNCFLVNNDLQLFKDSFDLANGQNLPFDYLNQYSIPFYWATVLFFRKNKINEYFFQHIKFIRDNWNYYRILYQITDKKFRNDFAFSIAVHTFNGFINNSFRGIIPGKIKYLLDDHYLQELTIDSCTFFLSNSSILKTHNTDIHVMNKYSLLRNLND